MECGAKKGCKGELLSGNEQVASGAVGIVPVCARWTTQAKPSLGKSPLIVRMPPGSKIKTHRRHGVTMPPKLETTSSRSAYFISSASFGLMASAQIW
jgi:hypothetical protein